MATRNIVPRANGEGSIGTAAKHWGAGHFDTLPNWQEYLAESTGYGIVSDCEPSISGLTVTVGAGIVHLADGTRKEITQTSVTLDSADSTNPRIDLVYINADGVVAKVTGTAAASPSAPTLPTGGINVAQVTVAANTTAGTLTDMRDYVNKPKFIIYENVAELKKVQNISVGEYVKTLGYYAPMDGGGGEFVITNANDSELLCYKLDNGLYAKCLDENIVLPRYGGLTVNAMMDNARPYLQRHRWKTIILPNPNEYHPGCDYWTENSRKNYLWLVDAPILFDEDCAYSYVYFYGDITTKTANLEAVLKVSDVSKPEDIYFMTHVRVGGYHYNGQTIMPDHAVLIEGTARCNFISLQAGYAANCITLGGTNQNNSIDVHIGFAEIGSFTNHAINGDVNTTQVCIFQCQQLVIQRPLANDTIYLYGVGNLYDWYIGSLQTSAVGETYTRKSFYFDVVETPAGANSGEVVLRIDVARMDGNLGTLGKGGTYSFGLITLASTENDTLTITGKAHAVFQSLNVKNFTWNITVSTPHGMFNAQELAQYPTVRSGRNIIIGGVAVSGTGYGDGLTAAIVGNVLSYDADNKKMWLLIDGNWVNEGDISWR